MSNDTKPGPGLKRIGIISTTRADSGIYRPLVRALAETHRYEVVFFAGGTHGAAEFGNTIETLCLPESVRLVAVDHHGPGDTPADVARGVGRAVAEFGAALQQHRPDLAFVLGDRAEMLAAGLAAAVNLVPLAHLHGGDTTEGAYDDAFRHALTQLSHLHFPALPAHAERLRTMKENPARIHVVGSLALDELARFVPPHVNDLSDRLGVDLRQPTLVVAYHMETLSSVPPEAQIDTVLSAVCGRPENLLLVGTNADVGHGAVMRALQSLATRRSRSVFMPSLAQTDFWGCLAHGAILVGNSSAGVIEAASLHAPSVNVGDRQKGRVRPASVIDVPLDVGAIGRGLDRARSAEFRERAAHATNPYGDGRAAERILGVLQDIASPEALLIKRRPG